MAEDKSIINHLKEVEPLKEAVNWVLEKQSELRSEILAFYKKDIKEIDSALSSIEIGESGEFRKKILEKVQQTFLDQWLRSYDLVCPASKSGGSSVTE
jgi:hypothetical protein